MKDSKPYLSVRPARIEGDITVKPAEGANWDYTVTLGWGNHLFLTATDANAILVTLATALYDDGGMSMEAAERVNYLSGIVLRDPAEAREAAMMEAGE